MASVVPKVVVNHHVCFQNCCNAFERKKPFHYIWESNRWIQLPRHCRYAVGHMQLWYNAQTSDDATMGYTCCIDICGLLILSVLFMVCLVQQSVNRLLHTLLYLIISSMQTPTTLYSETIANLRWVHRQRVRNAHNTSTNQNTTKSECHTGNTMHDRSGTLLGKMYRLPKHVPNSNNTNIRCQFHLRQ